MPAGSNPAGGTRAVIYARISKDDPSVDAIADQERRCRDLAEREGYAVVAVHSDDGISGFSGKYRPGWIALQHDIQSRMVDVILAVAEDRFTRSSEEKEGLKVVCARAGVRWHTLGGGLLDPATAGGSLMATITGGIAEYESKIKSERVAASVVRRRLEGKDIGGPRPFGFTSDRHSLIETEAELVREGHRLLLGGASMYAVTKMFMNAGVPTVKGGAWAYVIVRKVMTRPRNAALAVTKEGERYELSQHPAIVSREDHEAVVAILTNSSQKLGRKAQHLASGGVARCGTCGSPLRYSSQKGGLYRCNAANSGLGLKDGQTHASVKAEELDARIVVEVVPSLMARLRRGEGKTEEDNGVRVLLTQKAELERQRDETQELWTIPGANKARLRVALASFGEQIESIEAQVDSARVAGVSAVRAIAASLIGLSGAPDITQAGARFSESWKSMQLEEQRSLVRALLEVKINPAASARKVRIADGEVITEREGPERISIRHI